MHNLSAGYHCARLQVEYGPPEINRELYRDIQLVVHNDKQVQGIAVQVDGKFHVVEPSDKIEYNTATLPMEDTPSKKEVLIPRPELIPIVSPNNFLVQ